MTTISRFDDVIDSRDIIERIEELESELNTFLDATDGDLSENFPDIDELKALRNLANEAQQYSSDWQYGETLIHRDYFVQYTEELINDCYELPDLDSNEWPFSCMTMDYETAAYELEKDYTSVYFKGQEYLMRNC